MNQSFDCNYKNKLIFSEKILDAESKFVEIYCKDTECKEKIAIKGTYVEDEEKIKIPKEIKILEYISKNIDNKHFAEFYGWDICPSNEEGKKIIIMFFEYFPMTLRKWTEEKHSIEEWIDMLSQVNEGIKELEFHKIFHDDIHLDNILYNPKRNKFVIIDFDNAAIGNEEYNKTVKIYKRNSMLIFFIAELISIHTSTPFIIRMFFAILGNSKNFDFTELEFFDKDISSTNFDIILRKFSKWSKEKDLSLLNPLEKFYKLLYINEQKIADLNSEINLLERRVKFPSKFTVKFEIILEQESEIIEEKLQLFQQLKKLESDNLMLKKLLYNDEVVKIFYDLRRALGI